MVKPIHLSYADFDPRGTIDAVEWRVSEALVPYDRAVSDMTTRAEDIAAGYARECVWLLEHPPIYTAGTSADAADLLEPDRFPVFSTGRGGQYTYHGPGQRIAYVMMDLRHRKRDVRAFVCALEEWIIASLATYGVTGERRDGRVGVWVRRPGPAGEREDKIAAIGVRIRKWVTFHGISLNVEPNLEHFSGIVPCGVADHGVTSLKDLGVKVAMEEVDAVLQTEFMRIFSDDS